MIIQQPVYDPFATIVKNDNRKVVNNGLVIRDGHFEMNLEELFVYTVIQRIGH